MNIDQSYNDKLLLPLRSAVGIKISHYLTSLSNSGVEINNNSGVINDKFIAHCNALIRQGLIVNSSGKTSLESFGLAVGTNGHISYWNCSDIIYVEHKSINEQEDLIDIKPNFMGLGINFNALYHKFKPK